MKKFTAFALCFVLIASLLTACRSKAPEETNSPTTSTNMPATTDATMPTILPTQGTEATNGSMDATGGTDSGTNRSSRRPMQAPMG